MNQEQTLKDILDIVQFMQSEMATKSDISELRTEIKGDISELRTETYTIRGEIMESLKQTEERLLQEMDGFIGLHKKLDVEFTMLRSKYARLEDNIHQLASAQDITLN